MLFVCCIERIIIAYSCMGNACVCVCSAAFVQNLLPNGVPNNRILINQVNRKTSFIIKNTHFLLQCNNIYNEEKLYNKPLYA